MRKLGSEKELEQKKKRNTLILSIFMLLVLIGGTAGYAFITNPGSTIDPNAGSEDGSELARFAGNRWIVNVDGLDMSFANSPESVSDIPVDQTTSTFSYIDKPLYIVSENNAVNAELGTVLSNYVSRIQRACYGPCEDDLPEKDCSENMIIWEDSVENRVYQEENCIFIEGDLRAVDAFLYHMLGINAQPQQSF